ncbi:MAG: hypothetical protein WBE26_06280 [Phycisphaerae bacterium]
MLGANRFEEGDGVPTTTSESELGSLPRPGANGCTTVAEWIVYAHFQRDRDHLYVVEHDPKTNVYFGFVIRGGNYDNAVWEYFAVENDQERRTGGARLVLDRHWKPRRVPVVQDIARAYQAQGKPW